MAVRTCKVTYADAGGVEHTVAVSAQTLYEAVARVNYFCRRVASGRNVTPALLVWTSGIGNCRHFGSGIRCKYKSASPFRTPAFNSPLQGSQLRAGRIKNAPPARRVRPLGLRIGCKSRQWPQH